MRVRTLAFRSSFFSGTMNQPAGISFVVIVNVRAEEPAVNSQKVVHSQELHFRNRDRRAELLCIEIRYWRGV